MQAVSQALDEVKDLYRKVVGQPVPKIDESSFIGFPLGVDPLNYAIEEVRQIKQLTEQMKTRPEPVTWVPHADTYRTRDAFVVRVELAGVPAEDLKVLVQGGECVINGKRKLPEIDEELRPIAVERPWGPFERRFTLPPGSHPDKVTARYSDGVLEVRIVVDGDNVPKEMKVDVA